jgi:hypothetical protein
VTTTAIADLLGVNRTRIEAFEEVPEESLLVLPLMAIDGTS